MAMYWCYVWGSMFYLSWFPTYLVKGRGFSQNEMAVFASLPFVLGAIGNLAGGVLSDKLVPEVRYQDQVAVSWALSVWLSRPSACF